jgi:hypothetical protein
MGAPAFPPQLPPPRHLFQAGALRRQQPSQRPVLEALSVSCQLGTSFSAHGPLFYPGDIYSDAGGPARGATDRLSGFRRRELVSIHALHEGRPGFPTPPPARTPGFNPRPCTRGDGACCSARWRCTCFNPRPCTRGDQGDGVRRLLLLVSIHAPARGATCVRLEKPPEWYKIQSTPLHEGRLRVRPRLRLDDLVSIHAPARGATGLFGPSPRHGVFQSTPLHEGRPAGAFKLPGENQFQSTPLHEGRRSRTSGWGRPASFNPRPCTRGDPETTTRRNSTPTSH